MKLYEETDMQFQPWPKIPRLKKERITITEKMDGTNSCIIIEDGEIIGIQSRKRFIYPEGFADKKGCDNAGFAGWVQEHEEELLGLGDGHHYGEWAGPAIQKNPHNLSIKRFYLFNTQRWGAYAERCPKCCTTVRVLYEGPNTLEAVEDAMLSLQSIAKMEEYVPEGVIIFNHLAKNSYKRTYTSEEGKWQSIS